MELPQRQSPSHHWKGTNENHRENSSAVGSPPSVRGPDRAPRLVSDADQRRTDHAGGLIFHSALWGEQTGAFFQSSKRESGKAIA